MRRAGLYLIHLRLWKREKDDYVDALGHDWDEGTITSKGDCQHKSIKRSTCSRCNKIDDVEGNFGDHSHKKVTFNSTCTEYNNNGSWSKRCNSYYSSSVGLANVTNYIYGSPTTL